MKYENDKKYEIWTDPDGSYTFKQCIKYKDHRQTHIHIMKSIKVWNGTDPDIS